MKQVVLGLFSSRARAEELIRHLTESLGVRTDDISYIYRNTEGDVEAAPATDAHTPASGAATGALVGGSVGALAGIATAIGVIPVIGPIFAAGPLVAALGIGTASAVGTTAVGAATGAVAGGVIGALVNLGAPDVEAKEYENRILAGDVLVAVTTDEVPPVHTAFTTYGATDLRTYGAK
ncbi:MAG TPA: hypothetical protein VFS75_01790 [Candidatus Paceibacterota bacterium]|nr:hypothetical protein [Candidatus Paceibacterota bacterium]